MSFLCICEFKKGEEMNYIERAIETSARHVCISAPSDPAARGLTRENAVIAITGAFGVSSKTIIQRHLGLNRESANKLINRLKKKGVISVHPTYANTDRNFIILTSFGIREAELLLNRELNLRSDVSRVNERNLIHDLSVQLIVLELARTKKISGFATERDLAIQLEHRGNDPRLVDALIVDADTQCKIALEMEASNAKNKSNGGIRRTILSKYLEELESNDGLYEFVHMYSHRQRFLTQIEKAHTRIFDSQTSPFTASQKRLLLNNIKFKSSHCSLIYELMFNSKRLLSDGKCAATSKINYLEQLAELEKLAKNTQDRVIDIRLEGFRDAGKALGVLE